ncbi:MAG: hypothetical protein JW791_02235 [Nanoarchaeota archaeon]|nr:hypothetical protein [Nanoarchaeota archaeon]
MNSQGLEALALWTDFFENNRCRIKKALDDQLTVKSLAYSKLLEEIYSSPIMPNISLSRYNNTINSINEELNFRQEFVNYLNECFRQGIVPDPEKAEDLLSGIKAEEQIKAKEPLIIEDECKSYWWNNNRDKNLIYKIIISEHELNKRQDLKVSLEEGMTDVCEDAIRAGLVKKAHDYWKEGEFIKAFNTFEDLNKVITSVSHINRHREIKHNLGLKIGNSYVQGRSLIFSKPFMQEQISVLEDMIAPDVSISSEGKIVITPKPEGAISLGKKYLNKIKNLREATNTANLSNGFKILEPIKEKKRPEFIEEIKQKIKDGEWKPSIIEAMEPALQKRVYRIGIGFFI